MASTRSRPKRADAPNPRRPGAVTPAFLDDARSADSVFINCPFDSDFDPIFDAIVFAVVGSGFWPRCSKELDDGSTQRLDNILQLIGYCRYGIHDLSRVQLDMQNLPRFNMPFELGLDWGCSRFGDATQKRKRMLLLESEQHRHKKTTSDLGGVDARIHGNDVAKVIDIVVPWLASQSKRGLRVRGPEIIFDSYREFVAELPAIAKALGYRDRLPYQLFRDTVHDWFAKLHGAISS